MEASSDKSGCWMRDPQSGQLIFLSATPPDHYKPILTSPIDPSNTSFDQWDPSKNVVALKNMTNPPSLSGKWSLSAGTVGNPAERALIKRDKGYLLKLEGIEIEDVANYSINLAGLSGRSCGNIQDSSSTDTQNICFVSMGAMKFRLEVNDPGSTSTMSCTGFSNGMILKFKCTDATGSGTIITGRRTN